MILYLFKQKKKDQNSSLILQHQHHIYGTHKQLLIQIQEFQIIVRNGEDCQKTLSKLKQINLPNILAKYKQLFPEFLNKQVSKQINSKIVDFNQFLKQAVGLLQNLEKMTQQIFSARKKANDKYFNLIEVLMPDYEKNCFSFYKNSSNQQIFTASNVQEKQNYLAELSKNKQNDSIIYLFEEIRKEKFQIQAFEEAIKKKQMYLVLKNKAISKLKDLQIQLVKLNAGKQSFFSKITKKSKEDQLKQIETSIQKAQQQEQVLALICQVITSLLGYSEIQRFKKFRQKSYYELLQKFFSMELEESRRKRKFWTQIGQNSSIKIQVEKSTQNIQVYEQEKDNFFGDEASYEQNKTQQKEQLQKNQQINTQQRETQTEFHQNPLVALENQDQQEQNTQNQKGQQLLQEQVQENEQNMDD